MEQAKKYRPARTGRDEVKTEQVKEVSRLNLALPGETRRRLEQLQAETGAATLTETISNALRLYEWLVEQKKRKREVLVREPGKESKLVEFLF